MSQFCWSVQLNQLQWKATETFKHEINEVDDWKKKKTTKLINQFESTSLKLGNWLLIGWITSYKHTVNLILNYWSYIVVFEIICSYSWISTMSKRWKACHAIIILNKTKDRLIGLWRIRNLEYSGPEHFSNYSRPDAGRNFLNELCLSMWWNGVTRYWILWWR